MRYFSTVPLTIAVPVELGADRRVAFRQVPVKEIPIAPTHYADHGPLELTGLPGTKNSLWRLYLPPALPPRHLPWSR